MKTISMIALAMLFGSQVFAYDTCQQPAERIVKYMARLNDSHAQIVTHVEPSDSGETVEVTLDNKYGGQSVTYTVTLTDSDPCTISKVEITGEE